MFEHIQGTSIRVIFRHLSGLILIAVLVACGNDDNAVDKSKVDAPAVEIHEASNAEADLESIVTEEEPGQDSSRTPKTLTPEHAEQSEVSNAYDLMEELMEVQAVESGDSGQEINELLRRLQLQGANALIPIRDALMEDGNFLDSRPELRLELLNVLLGLGVPEVEDVAVQLLASSPTAPEVIQLALYLEGLEPGKYSDSIRLAAEQTLMNSDPSSILSPEFFTLLGELGNEETAMVLAETPLHDEAYASFALASIPDGSGLRQLEQEARLFEVGRETPRGELAIQLLAQQAPAFPDAAATLIELAEKGAIPDNSWPYILDIVAGNWKLTLFEPPPDLLVGSHTYLSPQGNQVIYRIALLPEQRDDGLQSQRIFLLDSLQKLAPPSF